MTSFIRCMPSLPGISTETVFSAWAPCCQKSASSFSCSVLPDAFNLAASSQSSMAADGAVLVADVRAHEIAVRLLRAEDESLRPVLVDRAGDPLEADVQIVDRADAVAVADAANQLRRDQRFDEVVLRRQPAESAAAFADIIGQQRADLIAGERPPFVRSDVPLSGAAQPKRSQSGSVAMTKSAPTSFARAMIASNTRGFSGFET